MRNLKTLLTAVVIAPAVPIQTVAAELPQFLQKEVNYHHHYFGVGASRGNMDVNAAHCDSANCDEKSAGVKIFYGQNPNRNFGFETGVIHHGETEAINADADKTGGASLYGVAIGTIPLNKRFDLLVKIGAHAYHINAKKTPANINGATIPGYDTNQSGIGLLYGIGANFNIDESNTIRLDYEVYAAKAKRGPPDVAFKKDHDVTHIGLSCIRKF